MAQLLYTVRVTVPNEKIAAEYIQWLRTGHTQAVRKYADRARIFRLDESKDGHIQFDSLFEFEDRAAFEKYVQEVAPALREDAAAKFGPSRGIRFERWTEQLSFETSDA